MPDGQSVTAGHRLVPDGQRRAPADGGFTTVSKPSRKQASSALVSGTADGSVLSPMKACRGS
jgi:hypothetical protein